jgi:hypothetical protein
VGAVWKHLRGHGHCERWQGAQYPVGVSLDTIGRIHLEGAVALTLLVGGVGWIVNRLAGRVVVNAWNAAIVLLLVGGVGLAVQWVPRIPSDLSAFQRGEALGALVGGPITFPLLFALWRSLE